MRSEQMRSLAEFVEGLESLCVEHHISVERMSVTGDNSLYADVQTVPDDDEDWHLEVVFP